MSISPSVCHFCITQDNYQSISPPLLDHIGCLPFTSTSVSHCPFYLLYLKGCLPVYLTSTSASHRCLQTIRLPYLSIWPPPLYLTGCLPVHLTSTSVSHRMSTCPFDLHICISQGAYLSVWPPGMHLTVCVYLYNVQCTFDRLFCISEDIYQSLCPPLLFGRGHLPVRCSIYYFN